MPPYVSPEVLEFVTAHVASFDDLIVLITCMSHRDHWWDAGAMGDEVEMPVASAQRAMERLARRNLLDVHVASEVRYRFNPTNPELESGALQLLSTYARGPLVISQLLNGIRRRPLQDVADAFRVRRNDDT